MSFSLYLMRHGATLWNEEQRHQGRLPGIALSPAGVEQVREQACLLQVREYAAIVSSPLQRAIDTTQVLLNEWGKAPAITIDERFNEWDIPVWNRKTLTEIAESDPAGYSILRQTPTLLVLPGAETLYDVQTRVLTGIQHLAATYSNERVLVVTHVAVIVAAICGLLDIPLALYRQFPISNASLTIMEGIERPQLRLFNWHPSQIV